MKIPYHAKVANDLLLECLGEEELALQPGDSVILRCDKYLENAVISEAIGEPIADEEAYEAERAAKNKGRRVEGDRTPVVLRKVTPEDLATIEENEKKAIEAQQQAKGRIQHYQLDMRLIHTHYSLDRKLILLQFSAEARVDFRELLRDLSALFHARVELRQIGVRDEAALLGGLGTCGRPLCCKKFLRNFNSINVRMAKQQGIALNPQNISGCCGRLKCCLAYEAEYYRQNPVRKFSKNAAPSEENEEQLARALDDAPAPSQASKGGFHAARPVRNGDREPGKREGRPASGTFKTNRPAQPHFKPHSPRKHP